MTADEQFWWNWYIQLATAIATFLAVLVALFLDWIRSFFPPNLVLISKNERGVWTDPTYMQKSGQPPFATVSRWYHVEVSNTRRWRRATDTQVYLINYEILNAAGEYVPKPPGAIPLKIRNVGFVETGRNLGPPIEWDLCSIIRESGCGEGPVLQLQVAVVPTNMIIETRQKFQVALTLQARSVEADSDTLRVEIIWNGQWDDDESRMAQNLIV